MKNDKNYFFIGLLILTIFYYIYYQLKILDDEKKDYDNKVIVSIGNEKVTNKYFATLMKNKIDKMKRNEQWNEKIIEDNNSLNQLKSQTMNEIIEFNIYLDLAKKFDIKVSKNEIKNFIEKQEAFKKFDKFDKNKYLIVLKELDFSIEEYENSIKNELIVNKFLSILITNNKDEYNIISTLFSIEDYLKLDIIPIVIDNNITFTENDYKEFYEINKVDLFRKRKTFDIKYIKLNEDNNITISNEEIESYYKEKYLEKYFNSGNIISLDIVKVEIENTLKESKNNNFLSNRISSFKLNKIKKEEIFKTKIEIEELNEEEQIMFENYKNNDFTKPFNYKNNKIIAKIENITMNNDKFYTFDESKNEIKDILINNNSYKKAFSIAYDKIENNNFSIDVGFIGNKDYLNLKEYFNFEESKLILDNIFHSTEFEGIVELDGKLVIYKVLDSRINKDNENSEILNSKEIENYLSLTKKLELTKILKEEYKNKVIFY